MIDQFTNLITDGTTVVLLAIKLGVIIGIGITYWKTRSAVPTAVSLIVGGLVWWGVNNVDTVSNKVDADLNKVDADLGAPSPVVFELPEGVEW